jgi:CDP-glucose 4,6-dehydratase
VLVVTSDKCYANPATPGGCREVDALGGREPYGASKAAAEIVATAFSRSYESELWVATVRAGNVIGGGDWAPYRLIPDVVRATAQHEHVDVRRPEAVRPWQHVLEPVFGYLTLAARLLDGDALARTAVNFGPDPDALAPVSRVLELVRQAWPQVRVVQRTEQPDVHEEAVLTLNNERAAALLGWRPVWDLATATRTTVSWYRRHLDGEGARDLCAADVDAYETHRRRLARDDRSTELITRSA